MQDLLAAVRGRSSDLLPFDEVKERFHLRRVVDRGIQEVPLSRIAGTLGREQAFNRAFLPREESLRERWDEVHALAEGQRGFPPVELYRVGDVDFVVDGHHRVSVARALGVSTIEARVKEFATPVPLPPGASLEDVLIREGLADFLEATGLTPESPDEFRVTEANGYERLVDHIKTHRYYLGLERRCDVSREDALASWRDTVYRPMVAIIRRSSVLAEFPGRTETDLYLFTMDHLHHLRERYAGAAPTRAVEHFRLRERARERAWERLRNWWARRRTGS